MRSVPTLVFMYALTLKEKQIYKLKNLLKSKIIIKDNWVIFLDLVFFNFIINEKPNMRLKLVTFGLWYNNNILTPKSKFFLSLQSLLINNFSILPFLNSFLIKSINTIIPVSNTLNNFNFLFNIINTLNYKNANN